jgi:hypothetical protein
MCVYVYASIYIYIQINVCVCVYVHKHTCMSQGDSKNCTAGSLGDQTWWAAHAVNQVKGKYGAKPGHLPVACYW